MTTTAVTTTSSDGTRIAYDRAGEGLPVVLVGGGPADRSANAGLAALLAERFTVYNYDRRGRGESGDTDPYHPDREFDDLDAIIAEAGGTAGVYGSSGAGIMALDVAGRGLPLSAVAVWEPPYYVGENGPSVSPDWGDRVDGLVHDAALLGDFSMPTERIARITVPTLVVDGGAAAGPTIHNAANAVVTVVAHAERRSLEGQPHNVAPDVVAPALTEFFIRTTTGGRR